MTVVGTELKVLRAVAELGQADTIRVGQKAGIASHYADYLCKNLMRDGYLTKLGRRFSLTPVGEGLLEKKAEAERAVRVDE